MTASSKHFKLFFSLSFKKSHAAFSAFEKLINKKFIYKCINRVPKVLLFGYGLKPSITDQSFSE